ncbi:NAC transcription factor 32-like [Phragmites australis]|uniref:NAC transcription factor 32-like n=1 Tax=Phragmites australis TaxID=29695 RepID=UPI002D7A20E9|nr:NAC transcription factor 32-like [Phragmites australis]
MEFAAFWPRPLVPPGYRFTPTPEELIRYYLDPWVTARLPAELQGIVCVADVYSADPDTLTSQFQRFGHDGNWYFLCVNRWKGGKAGTCRMNRCVQGGGTWHGSGKRKPVGRCGYRQGLEYRDVGGNKTAWIMEEFGSSLPATTDGEGVKVICKVHRSPRAAAAKRSRLHGEHGHTAGSAVPSPADVGRSYDGTSQAAPVSATAEEGRRETNMVVSKRLRLPHEQGPTAVSAAPSPPDVECSYAVASRVKPVTAAASTTRQQPIMEQSTGHHRAGVNGGAGAAVIKDEPKPLEMVTPDLEWQQFAEMDYGFGWQQFAEMDYGFGCTADDARLNEWTASTFSKRLDPSDGVEKNDDPRGDTAAS